MRRHEHSRTTDRRTNTRRPQAAALIGCAVLASMWGGAAAWAEVAAVQSGPDQDRVPEQTGVDDLQAQSVDPLAPRTSRPPEIYCAKTDTLITLASADVAQTVNFAFERARVEPVSKTITRSAEIEYDGNQYARLSSRAPGVIAEVKHDLGESVQAGDVLAVVDSVELGAAKAEWLQSVEMAELWRKNADRERALVEQGAGVEREALEAETRHAEARITEARARQKLRNLGLTDEMIAEVGRTQDTSSRLSVVAPFDGIVVERNAVIGEVVESSRPLMAVADTNVMWALIDLQEADLRSARVGQEVIFAADGLRDRPFAGRLTWISTAVDPKTRTIKARAELDNGSGLLRAHMFGTARVNARKNEQAVTVPKDAVQWEGCCNVVFVKSNEAGTEFRPRKVHLGLDAGERFEVLRGLQGGETIATRGSYLLKTELMKGSIGAGCCEVDHLAK